MNAFRKLLLAPLVMGVVAPLASQAQSLDMGSVNRYQDQQDIDRMRAIEAQMGQVTSVSQFSEMCNQQIGHIRHCRTWLLNMAA